MLGHDGPWLLTKELGFKDWVKERPVGSRTYEEVMADRIGLGRNQGSRVAPIARR